MGYYFEPEIRFKLPEGLILLHRSHEPGVYYRRCHIILPTRWFSDENELMIHFCNYLINLLGTEDCFFVTLPKRNHKNSKDIKRD